MGASQSPAVIPGIAGAAAVFVLLSLPVRSLAHDVEVPIAVKTFRVQTSGGLERQRVKLITAAPSAIGIAHAPTEAPAWLLVRGYGDNGSTSGRIDLDPDLWTPLGNPDSPSGYRYSDRNGSRGGVTKIVLKPGRLQLTASGERWPWQPAGSLSAVWIYFGIADESYCASVGDALRSNLPGNLDARDAGRPAACRPSICSNAQVELGEECDDGNLVDTDGCDDECASSVCEGDTYDSTFEAIQQLVFEDNGCTNDICHGSAAQGGLDLRDGSSYGELLDVAAHGSSYDRIEPAAPGASALYLKLLKASDPSVDIPGDAMPSGLPPIHPDLLEAMRRWILSGAPETGTVAGTETLLGGCFPDPGPISIAPLPPPEDGTGFQLRMPPLPLPAQSEKEVCFATYYDVTGDVPALYKDATGEYFYSRRDTSRMDPHSHHMAILSADIDESQVNHTSFGGWTCIEGAMAGAACNPLIPGACGDGICRSRPGNSVACIGYGPPGGPSAISPSTALGGAGMGQSASLLPDGVYRKIPLKGFVYWNVHAFNLTAQSHQMRAYLNLLYDEQQLYEMDAFADAHAIYAATGIAPFTRATRCATRTFPQGTRLFQLSSHTHKRGEQFWIEDPSGAEIYRSYYYNDPATADFDPPLELDSPTAAARTFRYCAIYNNGVAPDGSPDPETVRTHSVTPPNGTACSPVACTRGRIGSPCGGSADHATCDSFPAAGDGYCDACAITQGVSTEDEMFILTGRTYQVTPP